MHFTPDIEDIRVGYECEISVPYFVSKPYIVSDDNLKYKWVNHKFELQEVYGADNCLNIDYEMRTPYLTKEQIEAEGWQHIDGQVLPEGFQYYKKEVVNDGKIFIGYNLSYVQSKSRLYIEKYDADIEMGGGKETIYKGECKDINTFRYICKLLKIK